MPAWQLVSLGVYIGQMVECPVAKYLKPDMKYALEIGVGTAYQTGRNVHYTSDPIRTECTACPFSDTVVISVECTTGVEIAASVRSEKSTDICETGNQALGMVIQKFIHDEFVAPQNAHNN